MFYFRKEQSKHLMIEDNICAGSGLPEKVAANRFFGTRA
jgi:hypothetical protein